MEDVKFAMQKRLPKNVSSVKRGYVPGVIGPNWVYARPAGTVDQERSHENIKGDVKDCL
jgi:hypothetical protein